MTDAIQNAITNGRNGEGCVVVFASGNDNSTINYPANAISDILAVGAISACGERKNPSSCDGENWWGSNYGVALDIVAPGVLIPTTDRTGSAGYGSGDYFMSFNGTSSACPHVTATAALILSVNPELTQKQVANIIESTAQKVGGYSYTTTSGRPNGTWNNEMGYGLVDAFAAVSQATGGIVNFIDQTVTSNRFVAGWQIYAKNFTVTNNSLLTFTFGDQIIIDTPFIINSGSHLTINWQ